MGILNFENMAVEDLQNYLIKTSPNSEIMQIAVKYLSKHSLILACKNQAANINNAIVEESMEA